MSCNQQQPLPPPFTYNLPIHPDNVGMVIGKGGNTIKQINHRHQGWANARLQKRDGTWPAFIIQGHPGHVADIAVEITGIAITCKIRKNGSGKPKNGGYNTNGGYTANTGYNANTGGDTSTNTGYGYSPVPSSPDYHPPNYKEEDSPNNEQ